MRKRVINRTSDKILVNWIKCFINKLPCFRCNLCVHVSSNYQKVAFKVHSKHLKHTILQGLKFIEQNVHNNLTSRVHLFEQMETAGKNRSTLFDSCWIGIITKNLTAVSGGCVSVCMCPVSLYVWLRRAYEAYWL